MGREYRGVVALGHRLRRGPATTLDKLPRLWRCRRHALGRPCWLRSTHADALGHLARLALLRPLSEKLILPTPYKVFARRHAVR